MHSTEMTIVATILTLILFFGICAAATDLARQWVRAIVLKELEQVIRKAICEREGEA